MQVGGTVGDIESMIFLEALRQFQFAVGIQNIMFIHVSLVPALGSAGEQKTKPTQHGVKELRSVGISPDVIVCRSTQPLDPPTRSKISGFCHVAESHVLAVHDVSNIYHVPLILEQQGVHVLIRDRLSLHGQMKEAPDLVAWREMAQNVDIAAANAKAALSNPTAGLRRPVKIALVGKYTGQQDAYLSVMKSFRHSAIHLGVDVDIEILWVEASDLEGGSRSTGVHFTLPPAGEAVDDVDTAVCAYEKAWADLKAADGICVPGGFGNRGTEGKILACKYARESKKPYLGLCLGMQVMVMEFARHVLNWSDANSTEFDDSCKHPVVVFMPEVSKEAMGGTMRLGARATLVQNHYVDDKNKSRTVASVVYGCKEDEESGLVVERHRHRYEVNPEKVAALVAAGLVFSGKDETGQRMEICELSKEQHPFFFGTQFHPEFKSRPNRPSPPFYGFLAVCAGMSDRIGHGGEVCSLL